MAQRHCYRVTRRDAETARRFVDVAHRAVLRSLARAHAAAVRQLNVDVVQRIALRIHNEYEDVDRRIGLWRGVVAAADCAISAADGRELDALLAKSQDLYMPWCIENNDQARLAYGRVRGLLDPLEACCARIVAHAHRQLARAARTGFGVCRFAAADAHHDANDADADADVDADADADADNNAQDPPARNDDDDDADDEDK